MSGVNEERMARVLGGLAGLEPDVRAADAAVARVRAAGLGPVASRPGWRVGAGLATVAIVLALCFVLAPGGSARAAERLAAAVRAARAYEGWVRVETRAEGEAQAVVAYINTIDGTMGYRAGEVDRCSFATLCLPALSECWTYDSRTGRIELTRQDAIAAERTRDYRAAMLTFGGLVDLLQRQGADLRVVQSTELGMDRYDIAMNSTAGSMLGAGGPATVWVDPASGLVVRTRMTIDGRVRDAAYMYAVAPVADVYALGVPRDAPVVDMRAAPGMGAGQAPPAAAARVLDKDGLLALVRARSAAMTSLRAVFSDRTVQEVPNMMNRSRDEVVIQGEKVRIDQHHNMALAGEGYQFRRLTAYDGARTSWYLDGPRPQAAYHAGAPKDNELTLQAEMWLALQLLCPVRPGGEGDDQSLESLLASSYSRLRDGLELVGDRPCYVVDGPDLTVWIDAERGCLPLRQVHRQKYDADKVMMEFVVVEAVQVDGFWFAAAGRKSVSEISHGQFHVPATAWEIRVERDASGRPLIDVNRPLEDAAFDARTGLPAEVPVYDLDHLN